MSEPGGALLYLDAGDALFRSPTLPPGPAAGGLRARARLVARALVHMGAGAVNVGRLDLAAGLGFLEDLGRDPGVPWVSTNLAAADGRRPFPRWRVVPWGGLRVGVVGLIRPDPPADGRLGLRVEEPRAALEEALNGLAAQGVDAVVCLSNLGLEAEKQLAREVPGVAVIVGGGTHPYLPSPPVVADTVILHAGNRGRYLGVLETDPGSLGSWERPRNLGDRPVLQARLANARRGIELLRQSKATPAQIRSVEVQVAGLEKALAELDRAPATFSHRIVPLGPSIPEDPEVAGWVREHKGAEVAARRKAAPPPPRPARRRAGPFHTGSAACRSCHPQAYRGWLATRHARSYTSLGADSRNPRCLGCHATRLERPNGPALEPVVGCETCHGRGGNHRGRGNIVRQPPAGTCRRCHRGFHPDEGFDYPKDVARVRCRAPGAEGKGAPKAPD